MKKTSKEKRETLEEEALEEEDLEISMGCEPYW